MTHGNRELVRSLAFVILFTALIMTLYEFTKSWLFPKLTLWESHLATIVVSSLLVAVAAAMALRKIHSSERQLQLANYKLGHQLQSLQQRSEEILRLSEMGGWLQSCMTIQEAYVVIRNSAERIFPQWSGALYAISSSRNFAERVAAWGDFETGEKVFAPSDCWAIRRGRPHGFHAGAATSRCAHTGQDEIIESLCIPLIAQGETLGILNLLQAPSADEPSIRPESSDGQRLASLFAEQIGLALGNLKLRDVLRNQSVRDPLTGLFNRRYLEETLERETSRAHRDDSIFAILMIDLDHFKDFNDSYGHQAGDAALRTVGSFFKNNIRGQDIACRYGGEEFSIVLVGSSQESILERAEAMRQGVKQLNCEYAGQLLRAISISMGIAIYPEHGNSVDAVLRAADQALYRAKSNGRDQVVFSDAEQPPLSFDTCC